MIRIICGELCLRTELASDSRENVITGRTKGCEVMSNSSSSFLDLDRRLLVSSDERKFGITRYLFAGRNYCISNPNTVELGHTRLCGTDRATLGYWQGTSFPLLTYLVDLFLVQESQRFGHLIVVSSNL